mmetsp:Transcript_10104/g.14576  ORF Transcript_10104/g.14576 Transcript_10104/m.14576 type:complete len:133 (+) Transcript_10104:6898-7296(+)
MTKFTLERCYKVVTGPTDQVTGGVGRIPDIKTRSIGRGGDGEFARIKRQKAAPAPGLVACGPRTALGGKIPAKNPLPTQEQPVANPATAPPILPTLGFPGVSKACGSKAAEIIRQSAVQNVSNPRKWFPKEQ